MTRGNIWLLSVLLVAALIAMVLFDFGDARDPEDVNAPPTGARRGEHALEGAGLEGTRTNAGQVDGPAVDPGASPSRAPLPAKRLTGTIRGASSEALQRAEVRVVVLKQYGWVDPRHRVVEGTIGARGTYQVDLAPIFTADATFQEIRVEVDCPAYLVARETIDVAHLHKTDTFELVRDVELRPALVVSGRLLGPLGEGNALGNVCLFRYSGGDVDRNDSGEPAPPVERKSVEQDGRFGLRAPGPGRYLFLAMAPGSVPSAQIVELVGAGADLGDVDLVPGVEVAGRATINGAPLRFAFVRVACLAQGKRLRVWPANLLLLDDGRVVPDRASVQTGMDGTFRIGGLPPGPVEVGITGIQGVPVWPGLLAKPQAVTAPAAGLEFGLEAVDLTVSVTSGDEPVGDARVRITDGSHARIERESASDGIARFLLPTGLEGTLLVTLERHDPISRDLVLTNRATTQQERVALGPAAARAVAVVHLTAPDGSPIPVARFAWKRSTDRDLGPDETAEERRADGVYRFDDAPLGKVVLHVVPGRGALEFRGYWLDMVEELDLEPGAERVLRLTPKQGGRLRIRAIDLRGTTVQAGCQVFDARGEERDVSFVSGDERAITISSEHLGSSGLTTVEPPLEPGEYAIVVRAEGQTVRKHAIVKPGETTDVRIELPIRK